MSIVSEFGRNLGEIILAKSDEDAEPFVLKQNQLVATASDDELRELVECTPYSYEDLYDARERFREEMKYALE